MLGYVFGVFSLALIHGVALRAWLCCHLVGNASHRQLGRSVRFGNWINDVQLLNGDTVIVNAEILLNKINLYECSMTSLLSLDRRQPRTQSRDSHIAVADESHETHD